MDLEESRGTTETGRRGGREAAAGMYCMREQYIKRKLNLPLIGSETRFIFEGFY